jgi:DNA-binding response OmpR family regulator
MGPQGAPSIAVTPQEEITSGAAAPQVSILLLDDDPGSRKLLRRLLDREDYEVHEVSAVSAAVAELRDRDVDLAIVNLNGQEGKTAVRTLRGAYPDLTVVVLSETVAPSEKSEKLLILPKPSRALVVLQNIQNLMSRVRRPEITHNVMP